MDKGRGRYQHVEYGMGWYMRDDGDIETDDGTVIPLEEFAASGRIDSVELKIALHLKQREKNKVSG